MATNEFGLDTDYIGKNLAILQRDIERYTPQEMQTALNRLANTCHTFAKCGHCGGYNTHPTRHDAASWYCDDCDRKYPLKDL
jgi:hypothetical protein